MKAKIEKVKAMVEGYEFEHGVFVEVEEGSDEWELMYMTPREDQAAECARLINEGYDIEAAISDADLM